MTAMRLKRYPSPSGGFALGKVGVGATMLRSILPAGARWVEYLESTGTQWIDTGYVPKIGDSVRMMFRLTRQPTDSPFDQIMGAGVGTYQFCFPTGLSLGRFYTGIWCRSWQGGAAYSAPFLQSNSIGPDYITDFRIEHLSGSNYRLSIGADYIDSKAMSEIDGSTEQRNLLIFRRPNVGNSWIKCYAFQLWSANSVLVRDFRPIAIGTTGYMLDLVSGEYLQYGNKGTGAFTIGPDANAPAI